MPVTNNSLAEEKKRINRTNTCSNHHLLNNCTCTTTADIMSVSTDATNFNVTSTTATHSNAKSNPNDSEQTKMDSSLSPSFEQHKKSKPKFPSISEKTGENEKYIHVRITCNNNDNDHASNYTSPTISIPKKCLISTRTKNRNATNTSTMETYQKYNRRLHNELKQLAPSYHSISNTTKGNSNNNNQDSKTVQLFASDFDYFTFNNDDTTLGGSNNHDATNSVQKMNVTSTLTSTIDNNSRPKRTIKQTIKYQPDTRSYQELVEYQQKHGKIGTGFLCPNMECNEHLSYDAKMCWKCALPCRYVAGVGVVVCKERDEIRHSANSSGNNNEVGNFMNRSVVQHHDGTSTAAATSQNDEAIVRMRKSKRKAQEIENENIKSSSLSHTTAPTTLTTSFKRVLKRDQSGKFISKSTATTTRKTTSISTTTSSSDSYTHHDRISECEACLRLFLSSYLQRHRRTQHNLPPNQYGCPYCTKTFSAISSRLQHIQRVHGHNKPHCVKKEVKDRTKVYLYNCPYSKGNCSSSYPMAFHSLNHHLKNEHDDSINNVLAKLTTSCPFCVANGESNNKNCTKTSSKGNIFTSMTSLWDHMKSMHEGCDLVGRRLNIGKNDDHNNNRSHSKGSTKYVSYEESEDVDDDDHYEEDTQQKEFVSTNNHWDKLSFDRLREFYNLDRGIVKGGQTHATLSSFIDRKITKIKHLEHCHIQSQEQLLGKKSEDDEYKSEHKLYLRGLRERAGKAASEALEKITYKDECEAYARWMEYENRGKRKTPEELETIEFIHRPFHFVSKSARGNINKTRHGGCKIGDSCGLCNGFYATAIITSEEIEDVGGNVLNAFPILSHDKRKEIRHLNFWQVSDHDIPDDREDIENVKGKAKSRRSRGQGHTNLNAWMEYWKLMEMRQSLLFINQYNEGLFQQNAPRK